MRATGKVRPARLDLLTAFFFDAPRPPFIFVGFGFDSNFAGEFREHHAKPAALNVTQHIGHQEQSRVRVSSN